MFFARCLRIASLCLACALAAAGCDDDSDTHSKSDPDHAADQDHDREHDSADASASEDLDAAVADGADASPTKPTKPTKPGKYVLSVIVFGPEITNTYVTLVDSLDVKDLDLKQGIEFAGQANVAAYGGWLYISDGESPVITRYRLTDEDKLEQDGTVSFANYGEISVSVDDTVNTFISKTKAYLSASDGTTLVWNPEEMTITGDIPIEFKETKSLPEDMSLFGSSGFARGNRLYRTYFWFDWATYDFTEAQYFATYDTEKDQLISLVPETRCPALSALVAADEKGTAYFSNWFYNLAGTLQKGRPSACALRLKPGTDELDADWALEFPKIADGHEGAQLSYAKNDKALFAAFHQEEITIKDDDTPYDIVAGPHWEAWSLDLKTQEAKPIEGIDRMGAQQTVFTIEGRTFLFAPNQDFDLTKVYEVKADGTSSVAFEIEGWSRAFLKLR
ncbi:MAG TPA: hypothetical protein VFG30_27265 [Polyangiales bacterium]|nr:hypothetical protein [Polyangiales bacterium]